MSFGCCLFGNWCLRWYCSARNFQISPRWWRGTPEQRKQLNQNLYSHWGFCYSWANRIEELKMPHRCYTGRQIPTGYLQWTIEVDETTVLLLPEPVRDISTFKRFKAETNTMNCLRLMLTSSLTSTRRGIKNCYTCSRRVICLSPIFPCKVHNKALQ